MIGCLAVTLLLLPLSTRPAAADRHGKVIVGGLIAGLIACAASSRCGGGDKKSSGGGGGDSRSPSDAVAMTREQRIYVQQGLASLGFYSGAIDAVFGNGTRNSIRNYQSSIEARRTGVLTGEQINDLVAAAPFYAAMEADDPRLFKADLARDLDKGELRRLQALLNDMGYNAGPEDGAWGGKTRAAVAAYKRDDDLPGAALPTRRLLARLEGVEHSPAFANDEAGNFDGAPMRDQGNAVVAVTDPEEGPMEVAPGVVRNFDIAGMRVGITREEFAEIVEEEVGGDIVFDEATAASFGGDGVMSLAIQATTRNWPKTSGEAAPEQFVALYEEDLPEFGALAIFRTILMSEAVTPEVFQSVLVPRLIENYGVDGKVSDRLMWIGDAEALAAADNSPAALAACGELRTTSIPRDKSAADTVWSKGGGSLVDTDSLGSVTRRCGDVLTVDYVENTVRIGLWNSDFILDRRDALEPASADAGVVVPEIEF